MRKLGSLSLIRNPLDLITDLFRLNINHIVDEYTLIQKGFTTFHEICQIEFIWLTRVYTE